MVEIEVTSTADLPTSALGRVHHDRKTGGRVPRLDDSQVAPNVNRYDPVAT